MNIPIQSIPQGVSDLFNRADLSIAVGGVECYGEPGEKHLILTVYSGAEALAEFAIGVENAPRLAVRIMVGALAIDSAPLVDDANDYGFEEATTQENKNG